MQARFQVAGWTAVWKQHLAARWQIGVVAIRGKPLSREAAHGVYSAEHPLSIKPVTQMKWRGTREREIPRFGYNHARSGNRISVEFPLCAPGIAKRKTLGRPGVFFWLEPPNFTRTQ